MHLVVQKLITPSGGFFCPGKTMTNKTFPSKRVQTAKKIDVKKFTLKRGLKNSVKNCTTRKSSPRSNGGGGKKNWMSKKRSTLRVEV